MSEGKEEIFVSSWRREKSEVVISVVEKLNKSRVRYDKPMFPTIKDLMVFAAMVGKAMESRRPIATDLGIEHISRKEIFDDRKNLSYFYFLALVESGSLDVILSQKNRKHEEEAVKVFEEYANGGFYTIHRWLEDRPGDESGFEALLAELPKLLSSKMNSVVKAPAL